MHAETGAPIEIYWKSGGTDEENGMNIMSLPRLNPGKGRVRQGIV